jgi:hypothetical protein
MINREDQLEEWLTLREFPRYQISSEGRIFNFVNNREMSVSINNFGHLKISLLDEDNVRRTKSVALLVAEAFVAKPNILCDRIIYLNGDFTDVRAINIAWRPRWFAWKYTHQLKVELPHYYLNLPVMNVRDNLEYENIFEAGVAEGLLFEHIWRSTYTGNPVYPNGSVWEVLERV